MKETNQKIKRFDQFYMEDLGWQTYYDDCLINMQEWHHPKYSKTIHKIVGIDVDFNLYNSSYTPLAIKKISDRIVCYYFHWENPNNRCIKDKLLLITTVEDYEHFIKYAEGDYSQENIKNLISYRDFKKTVLDSFNNIRAEYENALEKLNKKYKDHQIKNLKDLAKDHIWL